MKKRYIIDYCLYLIVKTGSSLARFIPISISVFIMRRIGFLAFYILRRKRRVAYKNLKIAFPEYPPRKINNILRRTFMNCAQHFIEIFYIPWIDDKYIHKFIEIEGLDDVLNVMENKKGGIFLALHEGSWEISNIVTAVALRKYNFTILVREQPKIPLLSKLLNEYRKKICSNIIEVSDSLRPLIETLKKGFAIGMVMDHGAQDGIFVDFFGRPALTPIGAMKLALRLDTNVIVGFIRRKKGAQHKITGIPYRLIKTGNEENDLKTNLENINRIYERYITESPDEYLWFFKRWKHSPQKNILILSDDKAGHLKQSLALLDLIKSLPFQVKYEIVEIKLKNKWQKLMLQVCGFFFSKNCQGCMRCMRGLFNIEAADKILSSYYDAVISCGSGLAVLNRLVAFENAAKSIVIMKPGMFSLKRFDLVIAPEHDNLPKFKNVVTISGAISKGTGENKEYINKTIKDYKLDNPQLPHPVIGLLLGGSNKYLSLDKSQVEEAINSLDSFLDSSGGCALVSTSRRTPKEIEEFLKDKLSNEPKYRMLIIANEFNPQGALEAILDLSDILVISGDSISMISEAVNSGKHTVALKLKRKFPCLASRHERFIDNLRRKECIYASFCHNLANILTHIHKYKPSINKSNDREIILGKLKKIL
ncbi:MAG: ELM1/GtrOC1 family putative glycosyltransferase [Candidatus Omnitrophica bacterium]|nr:ELM1/GtrOC1 family putative glycosyltransferase [Candidatus Omnitrophota bacterium]